MKQLCLILGISLLASQLHAQQISPGAVYAASNSASASGVSLDWVLGSINAQTELSVLPVRLISFEVHLTRAGDAELRWKTAVESGNQGFELQKSTDGRLFEKIAWIEGAGESSQETSYQFTDHDLCTTSYYRLKQIDWDGSFTVSRIVSVVPESERIERVVVYPNPSPDGIVKISLPERTLYINLTDSRGSSLTQQVNPSKELIVKLPVAGLYLLTVRTAREEKTVKLVRR